MPAKFCGGDRRCLVTKLCPTLGIQWTIAGQAPLSMGFSRQEYWTGLPFPSPGDLPDSGIKPRSPALQAGSLLSEPPEKPMNTLNSWFPNCFTIFCCHIGS